MKNSRFSFALALVRVCLILLPILLASPARAYGYADPGTGSFVYQAVYVAFLSGTYYFRKMLDRFWRKRKK